MRIFLLLFSTVFLSCGLQCKYKIAGVCDDALNGTVVTLVCSHGGTKLERISECEVKDGRFHFEGYTDEYRFCYIYAPDVNVPLVEQVFLEGGDMLVNLPSTSHK